MKSVRSQSALHSAEIPFGARAIAGGISDRGDILYYVGLDEGGVEPRSALYINDERIMATGDWINGLQVNSQTTRLTDVGNAIVKLDCQNDVRGITVITFNNEPIVQTGDVIAEGVKLPRLMGCSSNGNGDVIFAGQYNDGIDRIAIARPNGMVSPPGDFNNDGRLDAREIDLLTAAMRNGELSRAWIWPAAELWIKKIAASGSRN
jgi:hypothetical protein